MGRYTPGYVSLKQELKEKAAANVEPKTLWDGRKVVFEMANGWRIERVTTQKDAERMSIRLGGCWGTNIWPNQEKGLMMMFKMCKEDGTLMGGITLGVPGKSAYSNCDDLKIGPCRKPMTLDDKEYDVLEILAIPGYNIYYPKPIPGCSVYGPVNDKIRAMIREWYDSCVEGDDAPGYHRG